MRTPPSPLSTGVPPAILSRPSPPATPEISPCWWPWTLTGAVVGAVVREMEETFGLGAEALSDAGFLSQLIWSRGELAVGDNVDALTGATVTSKAVVKAVNSASAFVTGADVSSSATEWGG